MRTLLLIFLIGIATTTNAQTIKQDDIDKEYNKCIAADTSCAVVSDCAFRSYAKWEQQMKDEYDRLLHELKREEDKTALKDAQKAWLAYRDATFVSYDMMFNIPGDKWCRQRHEDRIDLVRSRALQLRDYYEALHTKIPHREKP